MAEEKKKGSRGISRREFLKDAGLVVGGAAVGAAITYPLVPKEEVVKEVEVIKEVEVTKYKCPYCGVTLDTFDALKSHITAQHPVEAIPEEVPTYVCPYCRAELDTFDALKAHVDAEHPPEVVEPAFEPEVSVIRGMGFGNFGRDSTPARVDVKNGKIVRIRPLHYDQEGYGPEYLKPWRMEVKGKVLEPSDKSQAPTCGLAYKKRVYSPNRIRYPLKRVDWEPGGDPAKINSQNRGISKYKKISWDEATDIIASELNRIQKKYGYFSVLAQADGHGEGKVVHGPHGCQTQLLRWMGPTTKDSYTLQVRTPDSWEGFYWGGKHMWGMETFGNRYPSTNLTKEMAENCELMITSGDMETTKGMCSGQFISDVLFWLSDVGVEQVYLAPDQNYSGAVHADKWIPVLPCQDDALDLAIAYTWIKEGTYDKDYLATHSVGFDKYKAHVLGDEDGIPKTPEWASPRCGVPEWTIKALARNWAKKRTSLSQYIGGARIRGPYSTEPARTQIALLGMQGMGAPGRAYFGYGGRTPGSKFRISFDKTLVRGEPCPCRGLEEWESAYDYFRPNQFIPKTFIHDAILKPPLTWWGGTCSAGMLAADQWRQFTFPIPKEQGGTEIHMIWTDTPCWTACWNGGMRYIQALQSPKIEFVLTEHPWMENDTLLSDIILPTTTKYEEYDICGPATPDGYGVVCILRHSIDPIGEAKTDYEVSLEVGKKLEQLGYPGLVDKYTWGRSVEDWMKYGWDTRELEEKTGMTWEQFKEREIYMVPTDPDWEKGLQAKPGGRAFYEDPKANPLTTPTGLLEYEATGLLEHFPDDKERPPVPHWIVGGPGWSHDERPAPDGGERAKKYPFLIISNHSRWGEHSQMDDCSWFREIQTCKVTGPDGYKYHPVWINPKDATKLGIKTGDVVSVYNERGTILCGALVTERLIPGAASIDHQARVDLIFVDPDVPRSEWIDRGGQINLICPDSPGIVSKNAPGQVASGFLVGIKKTDLADLRAKYPEAFARPYDPGYGLRFDAWVEGGM